MTETNLIAELEKIKELALEALEQANDEASLTLWKTSHLGRSAPVMQAFSRLAQVEKDQRASVGQKANQVKQALESAFENRLQIIKQRTMEATLVNERLDVTLPGRQPFIGRLHPITQTLQKIISIFAGMGFEEYRARDVETDEFSFELLNIPPYHPARDMWDTFHTTSPNVILRPHTSPGQIHCMREYAPEPIRVILPGMCYRYEQMDARHESQLMQVEVLAVGRTITFSDMKGTLHEFARQMYGENVRARIRPSYFPFTEPSADMEVECFLCGGKGCGVCRGSGWLEVMGCGMVHPTVLQNGGYDPATFSGFAAGMGVERVTMLRNKVDEIRNFYSNDVRFLAQF
jgi:phenylalanyl-tRNA synthetase alpha chain